jgi:hypothetical protein
MERYMGGDFSSIIIFFIQFFQGGRKKIRSGPFSKFFYFFRTFFHR